MVQSIYQFGKRIKTVYLISGAAFIMLLLSIITNLTSNLFSTSLRTGFPEFKSYWEEIATGLIIAPLLETIFLQCAIIESFKAKSKTKWGVPVSATIFGLLHFYNPFYFIYGILAGFVLGFVYTIPDLLWKRILFTYCTHLLYNLIVFTLSKIG